MASFTQEVGNPVDRTEDFTSRSRGSVAPEAQRYSEAGGAAGLITGLANLIPQIADVGEKAVEYDVQTQLYAANDATNKAFGVDLTSSDAVLVPPSIDVPDEVARELGAMKASKKAADLGRKSNTEYQSGISATLKKLYSRYQSPQMRDYIRQQSIAITGVDPDKGLRDAVQRDALAGSKAALQEQKDAFRIIQDAVEAGDYSVYKYTDEELKNMDKYTALRTFGPGISEKRSIETEKARLELLDKKLDTTRKEGVEVAQKDTSLYFRNRYGDKLEAIATAIRDNPDGGWMTDDKKKTALQTLAQIRAQAEVDIRTYVQENWSDFGFNAEDQNTIVSMSTQVIKSLEEGIKAGSTAELNYLQLKLDTGLKRGTTQLLSNELLFREKLLNDISPDFANFIRQETLKIRRDNDPRLADAIETIFSDLNGITPDGKPKSISEAIDGWKGKGITDAKGVAAMKSELTSHIDTYKDESLIGTDAANSKFLSIYGDKNANVFAKIPSADRFGMFRNMFDEKAYERTKTLDPTAVRMFDRRLQESYDITNRTELPGLMQETWWKTIRGAQVDESGNLVVTAVSPNRNIRVGMPEPVNSSALDRWNRTTSQIINTYKNEPQKAYRLIEGVIDFYGTKDLERANKLKEVYRTRLLGSPEEQGN